MSEALQVALIALAGVLIASTLGIVVSLLTSRFQRANTTAQIEAEFRKLHAQLTGEARTRLLGRKQDYLIDTVPALLAASDPQLHADFDYRQVVTLIHRVQLLLQPSTSADARLNHAVTVLGLAIQEAVTGARDDRRILHAHAEVADAAREVLLQNS